MDAKETYYSYQTVARGLLTEDALRRRFEELAPWYWARLRGVLPSDLGADILDAPCGFGNILYFLKKYGYSNVNGIDLDPRQVGLARSIGLNASQAEIFDILKNCDRRYHCIISADFIEHISRDHAFDFIRLCHSRLAPGGVLILRTPSADGPFGSHDRYNDVTHEWAMTANVLQTVLELHGFANVSILDERPQPRSPVGVIRLVVFHFARIVVSLCLTALGLSAPKVWSRSMWGVAYKPVLS